MNYLPRILLALLLAHVCQASQTTVLFNADWQFHRGDVEGAEARDFEDSNWRQLDLPHDWSIEDLPAEELLAEAPAEGQEPRWVSGPFDGWSAGGKFTGFTVGGIGWYRKDFTLPEDWQGKRVVVQFDGSYMNTEVWINGHYLGRHPHGYTSFYYDLTPWLLADGKPNTLAVKVNNDMPNSRWYSGSGIYRHVWLKAFSEVQIANWGVSVTTPVVSPTVAEISVVTTLVSHLETRVDVSLATEIVDPDGKVVLKQTSKHRLGVGVDTPVRDSFTLARPQLWSLESPQLYTVRQSLTSSDGKQLETRETPFGIRSIAFTADQGFLLNGKPTLLRGANLHHDNGPLGAAAFDRAVERKVQLMKDAGFNAIRTSHNPPAPALLDACDRLGMLVINEAFDYWDVPKREKDYSRDFPEWWQRDLASIILRDRNHPSIILWSIGNEILQQHLDHGARIAHELADFTRALDPTRPVTAAVCRVIEADDLDWIEREPFLAAIDVAGYNYMAEWFDQDHERHPNRVMMTSESRAREAFEYWMAVEDKPWVVGDFVWTGMDYLGETSVGWLGFAPQNQPWTAAFTGDLDLCGFLRPQAFYRRVLWGENNTVYPFVHNPDPLAKFGQPYRNRWGWPDVEMSWSWQGHEGKGLKVEVFSRCDEVRLVLNGRDLGVRKPSRETEFKAIWEDVPYEPGTLEAIGYNGPNQVATWTLQTAGEPAQLRLRPEQTQVVADGQDLAYVVVEVLDAKGQRLPMAALPVELEFSGPATLAGFGSANPQSVESFQQLRRTTFEGRALAIFRTSSQPGTLSVTARAKGLKAASVEIEMVAD